jgi:hypothetical protein
MFSVRFFYLKERGAFVVSKAPLYDAYTYCASLIVETCQVTPNLSFTWP